MRNYYIRDEKDLRKFLKKFCREHIGPPDYLSPLGRMAWWEGMLKNPNYGICGHCGRFEKNL